MSSQAVSPRPAKRLGLFRRLAALAFELTPNVFALLSFAAGSLMLASALTPAFAGRVEALSHVAPPLLIDLSHFAASVVGFLLLLLSAGLWRRRRGAYWSALGLLLAGAVFSLLKGLDWEEAADLVVVALLLAPCRAAFTRRSRLVEPLRPAWLLALIAAVGALFWLGEFTWRNVGYSDELWWTLIRDQEVSGFIRAQAVLALLTLFVAGKSLFAAPGAGTHGPASPAQVEQAARVLATADSAGTDAWLALLADKAILFSPTGESFIAYRVRGRRWIAMGEPAGRRDERRALLWDFAEMADAHGGAAVFYGVGEGLLADLATMGLAIRKTGETAVIDANAFSLEGKTRQNLRTAVNRAEREGASFDLLPPGAAGPLEGELRAVSDAWLDAQTGKEGGGGEKGFSLGRFDIAYLDRTPLAVVRQGGRVVAFANLLTGPERDLAVDLMRHDASAPPGTMDYLFIRTVQWAAAEGYRSLDLGMAPLAGLDDRRLAPVFARVGALVFDEGGALYGFTGLRAYKAKFGPDWRPKFIAAPASTPLALALLDVALLTSGGWLRMLGLRK